MANSAGVCASFKTELLNGTGHNFAVAGDTFKLALFLQSATINTSTTTYSTTGEVTATGYTAGGVTVTNVAPANGGWRPTVAVSYPITASTGLFDCALLYNTTAPRANKAVAVYTFTAQNVSGTFTLTMPAGDLLAIT